MAKIILLEDGKEFKINNLPVYESNLVGVSETGGM